MSTIATVIERLDRAYPDATYELTWENPFQLLVATMLAAQARDELVNRVTPDLFRKYPDAHAFADADLDELTEAIRLISFPLKKATAIQEACRVLAEKHGGRVPADMDALLELPRVARKTANVVLNVACKVPSGIIIDSHGQRVTQRLGITTQTKPEKIEAELMTTVPQRHWVTFGPALVLHGRYTCTSEAPNCPGCVLNDVCPKLGVSGDDAMPRKKSQPAQGNLFAEPTTDGAPVAVPDVPASWKRVLADEFKKPYWAEPQAFVAKERDEYTIFPPEDEVYTAFQLTPYEDVRVFLLGQDPYPGEGQAHGLCFSVKPGVALPGSLRNMYKELKDDLGVPLAKTGYLARWAEQGMLMLNAVLTVRAGQPNSHKGKGWETFTDAVIRAVNDKPDPVVFVLWGAYAQKKLKLIDEGRHTVIQSAHPSPLSASNGFFGSKPFSKINAALKENGFPPIDWDLTH